ncbi:hypothetical protein GGR56DRAFT_306792 [Xylariaceae sp. FL0804]|nr:hypothetical protein GGR56DRAFT_306792 [Xylariaceae sp. FL0804]
MALTMSEAYKSNYLTLYGVLRHYRRNERRLALRDACGITSSSRLLNGKGCDGHGGCSTQLKCRERLMVGTRHETGPISLIVDRYLLIWHRTPIWVSSPPGCCVPQGSHIFGLKECWSPCRVLAQVERDAGHLSLARGTSLCVNEPKKDVIGGAHGLIYPSHGSMQWHGGTAAPVIAHRFFTVAALRGIRERTATCQGDPVGEVRRAERPD